MVNVQVQEQGVKNQDMPFLSTVLNALLYMSKTAVNLFILAAAKPMVNLFT